MWTSLPADQRQGEKPISFLDWKAIPTKDCPVVTLTVSFGTGWQCKGSGHVYNSLSGHSFMIGTYTRMVLTHLVKSKRCGICNLYGKTGLPVPVHECVCNYKESSKGMETQMTLELTVEAKRRCGLIVGFIVADDDSSMRALLCHSYEHLSATMPEFAWPHAAPKEDGKLGPQLRDT
eukprot:6191169-Ditylum_brightwellii.AAC.1